MQVRAEPIGPAINAIRELLDPWLGKPSHERKKGRFKLISRFESEMPPVQRMRLKIEINTGEHFTVLGTHRRPIHCFQKYMEHGKTPVSRAQFEANLALKLADGAFRADVRPLLAQDAPDFDVDAAGERVKAVFLALLPGDSWKGPAQKTGGKKKKERRS